VTGWLSIENCVCAWSPMGWKNPFESETTPGDASVMTWFSPRRGLERQPRDQTLIDIGMRGRVALEQVLCVADDLNRRRRRERERHVDGNRHGAADLDVAFERLESVRVDAEVVRIRRQVAEHVLPGGVGRRRSREPGHRIGDLDRDGLHRAAGRISHGAAHRAGAAEPLSAHAGRTDCADGE
jgi:hypothetical protein